MEISTLQDETDASPRNVWNWSLNDAASCSRKESSVEVLNLYFAMDPFESLVKPTDLFSEKSISVRTVRIVIFIETHH